MTMTKKRLLAVLALSAVLAGCGGGGGGGGATAQTISNSVNALVQYMQEMIAKDENGDVVDINGLTLATDETSEPSPI